MDNNIGAAKQALLAELAALENRVKVIRKLLKALDDEYVIAPRTAKPPTDVESSESTIAWSKAIDRIFERHDGLKLADVRKLLVEEEGLEEALDNRYRPSISVALGRRVKITKTLRHDDDGRYYKTDTNWQVNLRNEKRLNRVRKAFRNEENK